MPTSLVAIRTKERDVTSCCGCGKNFLALHKIMGRYDYNSQEYNKNNWSIYLCWICYGPLKSKIELIK